MSGRRNMIVPIAWLASLGAGTALAQDNPWRIAPRGESGQGAAVEHERGFTQGYLRGFEQGYRRGAEQAGTGAPTANLGPRTTTGSVGGTSQPPVRQDWATTAPPAEALPANGGHGGTLTGTAPPPGPAPVRRGLGGSDYDQGSRAFRPPASQWGEYPPLDGDRPPVSKPAEPAARVAGPGYPYPPAAAPAQPAYPSAAQQQPAFAYPPATFGAPYAAAPPGPYGYGYGYGYGMNPALGGPSTLNNSFGSPFGFGPGPGIPFFGGW